MASSTDRPQIVITPTGSPPTSAGGDNSTLSNGFCGAEQRVSTQICNSLHPAVAMDGTGNINVVWHDSRDGNFEVYTKFIGSKLSESQIKLNQGFAFDPATGKAFNLSCSGFSGGTPTTVSTALITQSGGRLDVNAASRTMVLTAGTGSIDFKTAGVLAGSSVSIINGLNAGKTFFITRLLAPTVAELSFLDAAKADTGFVYAVSKAGTSLSSDEVRITCDKASSIFPDVIADSSGRFHVVYQDNTEGHFELYYVQMYPKKVGKARCTGRRAGVETTSFGPVAPGTPGSTTITVFPIDPATGKPDVTQEGTTVSFPATGNSDVFFSFGNKLLPDPVPVTDGPIPDRIGLHRLFKDFVTGSGEYTGVSKAEDRPTWASQALDQDITVLPDYVAPEGHPIANEGDFGTKFAFKNISFIAQTPPDKSVEITSISLPLKPKCLPDAPATVGDPDFADLVSAPKKPVPPGFQDPVDLSTILLSPLATVEENIPARFLVDGDSSGTVFTNIVTDNGRGELSRFVFNCSSDHKPSEPPRFILGQRRCGTELCALQIGSKSGPPALSNSAQYKITLQIWQGPDYRFLADQITSAKMENCTKILEKEFAFDPGDTITSFNFQRGELKLDDGRFLFIVPIPGAGVQFFIDAVGGGHEIWSTDSDGTFDQYYVPFTIQPNSGLNAPVYYEGFLHDATSGVVLGPPDPNGDQHPVTDCAKISTDDTIDADVATAMPVALDVAYTKIPGSIQPNSNLLPPGDPANSLPADTSLLQPANIHIPLETLSFLAAPTTLGNVPHVFVQRFHIDQKRTVKSLSVLVQLLGSRSGMLLMDIIKDADVSNAIAGTSYTALASDSKPSINDYIVFEPCVQLDIGDYAFVIKPTGVDVNIGIIRQDVASALPDNVGASSIPDLAAVTVPAITYAATLFIPHPLAISTAYTTPSIRTLIRFHIDLSDSPPPPKIVPPPVVPPGPPLPATVNIDFLTPVIPGSQDPISGFPLRFASGVAPLGQGKARGTVVSLEAAGYTKGLHLDSITVSLNGTATLTIVEAAGGLPSGRVFFQSTVTGAPLVGAANSFLPKDVQVAVDVDVSAEFAIYLSSDAGPGFEPTISLGNIATGETLSPMANDLIKLYNLTPIQIALPGVAFAAIPDFLIPFSAKFKTIVDGSGSEDDSGDEVVVDPGPPAGGGGGGDITSIIADVPIRITKSMGDSVHPRLAIDAQDNIWVVFHSNRSGTNEVFAGRYICGKWTTSALGGTDIKITNAAANGKSASFPNVAMDAIGDAHVVWQSDDTEDGGSDIFYAKTSGGTKTFSAQKRISASPGEAQMPDIALSSAAEISASTSCKGSSTIESNVAGSGRITVVWHDSRFNNYEILAASKQGGQWLASGQGGTDTRITQAQGDSLFPRIASDHHGNLRVVYHDRRRGKSNPWIFMSTYVAADAVWDSTAQGGSDLPITPTGTDESLHPDIAIDPVDGVFIVWHDGRFKKESPDQQEEIMCSYCPRSDSAVKYCGPICTNIEAFVSTQVDILDCVRGRPIDITNVPQVCISITSPGATFFRISEDGGDYSEWMPFQPDTNLDSTIMPWVLGPGSGKKNLCIQVQDATTVGFPVCKDIILQSGVPAFKIEFFKDADLTMPLDTFNNHPVAPAGDIFIRLTSSTSLLTAPTFDVISRGVRLAFNQQTSSVSESSGFSGGVDGAGVGSFAGELITTPEGTEFSAFGQTVFKGRFTVHRDDGFFHADGLARIIPHGKSARGEVF